MFHNEEKRKAKSISKLKKEQEFWILENGARESTEK